MTGVPLGFASKNDRLGAVNYRPMSENAGGGDFTPEWNEDLRASPIPFLKD